MTVAQWDFESVLGDILQQSADMFVRIVEAGNRIHRRTMSLIDRELSSKVNWKKEGF
jgi:hypothetical protein